MTALTLADDVRRPTGLDDDARALADALPPDDVAGQLRALHERYGDRVVLASSFGPEDMVLLHHAWRLQNDQGRRLRVFTLDTGRLPEETLQLADRLRLTWQLDIEVLFPATAGVEALVREQGPFGFFDGLEQRKRCCHVRKVEPLGRVLATADVWVTGLRREQAPSRTGTSLVAVDDEHPGLLKVSPLVEWTEARVWSWLAEHKVPTHKLHEQGYASIGCAPCTRAVPGWVRGQPNPGVDVRAGRWWWESPEHKECGLHPASSSDPASPAPSPSPSSSETDHDR